jgi:REP element-mobilizing transposase RayT
MLATHIILGAYGFWLPNDPRGSWSTFVGSWELFRYGKATKTTTTRSVAGREHDIGQRLAAKGALKGPPVHFTGAQALAVARGFARYSRRSRLPIFACAILPDHVHLVVGAHLMSAKQLMIQLKVNATAQLVEEGLHPFARLPWRDGRPQRCFAQGGWAVFLDRVDDARRAVRYVEDNPLKEGKPRQRWSFVVAF